MNAPMIVAACAFLAVGSLVLLVSGLVGRKPAVVHRRLDSHAVAIVAGETKRQERIEVLKVVRLSSIPALDAILSKFRPARTAAAELTRGDLSLGVGAYLMIRLLLGTALAVVAWIASGNLVFALVPLPIGLMAPRLWLRLRASKRLRAMEAQLAEALDLLVGSLRSGHGFLQGLESVAHEMSDPMHKELNRVIEQINVGINPIDALQEMSDRLPSYDLALAVAAISVQRQTGGNLAEVLDNLAATVRERRRVRGEVRALTTGPRVSSYVLAAVPFLLFIYFISISHAYRTVMMGSGYGHLLLGAATIWSLIGFFLSQKVSKVEY